MSIQDQKIEKDRESILVPVDAGSEYLKIKYNVECAQNGDY